MNELKCNKWDKHNFNVREEGQLEMLTILHMIKNTLFSLQTELDEVARVWNTHYLQSKIAKEGKIQGRPLNAYLVRNCFMLKIIFVQSTVKLLSFVNMNVPLKTHFLTTKKYLNSVAFLWIKMLG